MNREPRWGWPLLAGLLTAFPTPAAQAEPRAFSHDDWTAVLQRFVDGEGRVDYQALSEDRAALDRYLGSLARFSPESHPHLFPSREDALAYYLNAYNAYVFKGVLDRWPHLTSVWGNPLAAFNFFVLKKADLGGEKLHLKGLEEKTILAGFQEPRAHAVLNCASISCPRLRLRAVEPGTLDDQLDEAMREFVSHPKHFRLDEGARTVWISKVFDWFSSDFLAYEKRHGSTRPQVIDFVNRFRDRDAQVPRSYTVEYLRFDKRLNRQ